jgi:hypothetical protein
VCDVQRIGEKQSENTLKVLIMVPSKELSKQTLAAFRVCVVCFSACQLFLTCVLIFKDLTRFCSREVSVVDVSSDDTSRTQQYACCRTQILLSNSMCLFVQAQSA